MLTRDEQDQIKAVYPKRSGGYGWMEGFKLLAGHINRGETTFEEALAKTEEYRDFCIAGDSYGTRYVMQPKTFFGPHQRFLEEYKTEEQLEQAREEAEIDKRAIKLNEPLRHPKNETMQDYITRLELAEESAKEEQEILARELHEQKVIAYKKRLVAEIIELGGEANEEDSISNLECNRDWCKRGKTDNRLLRSGRELLENSLKLKVVK